MERYTASPDLRGEGKGSAWAAAVASAQRCLTVDRTVLPKVAVSLFYAEGWTGGAPLEGVSGNSVDSLSDGAGRADTPPR